MYRDLKTSYGDSAESIYDLLSDFLSSSNDIYRNLNKKLKDSEIAQITGVAGVSSGGFEATYDNGDVKIKQGIYSIELSMSDLNGCSVDDLQQAFNRL
ncbi:hypothetical protein BUZ61_10820 [Staphylococcus nepalensis]|uniref:Uncharacterized protein n=1 Tax=Staphylococcus nepalensis TaxID=214473 RepID=A0A2T4S8J1_9STAP|nr:hypothetical protein [Staphylococcus nepalensis]PTK58059.1 hypothetical protein BUZ61_10820 [Staphylococcus nepalensis]